VVIALNDESLNRDKKGEIRPYRPPYEIEPYISVPRTFWTTGLAGRLSGAGVAMYLVSLAMTRHDDPEYWLSGAFFDERFGISRSTRKRGLAELAENGVIEARSVGTVDISTFRIVRRNIYTVANQYLQPARKDNPTSPGETPAQSTSASDPAAAAPTVAPSRRRAVASGREKR
jgi:hypothetical protein